MLSYFPLRNETALIIRHRKFAKKRFPTQSHTGESEKRSGIGEAQLADLALLRTNHDIFYLL